jgi:hypothetical protein
MSEEIEFIGQPFDPRPTRNAASPNTAFPNVVATLLEEMREMIAAAHASALDTQACLQRRLVAEVVA